MIGPIKLSHQEVSVKKRHMMVEPKIVDFMQRQETIIESVRKQLFRKKTKMENAPILKIHWQIRGEEDKLLAIVQAEERDDALKRSIKELNLNYRYTYATPIDPHIAEQFACEKSVPYLK